MDKKNNNDVLASLGDQATDGGGLKPAADQSLGDQATFLGEASSLESVDEGLEVVDLASRYKIERSLGRGGMGEVSLATDTRLNRKVAIKRILGTASNNRTAVTRFLNEAQAIASLNHPNIVQIYDYGRAADGPFLIMEYVDGSSLLDRCRAGALPLEEAVELTCQICEGLSRAHEQGIIHRDIKPANVLLTRDGVPKLTDFGLAKVETADTGMTMAGVVLGTLDFMPPEQRRNASLVDARSDLWSLAATLYQMVTGRVPTVIKLNDVPRSLQDVLSKALEDYQDDRYQTAKDFKAALKSSLFQSSATAIDSNGALGFGECPQCHVKNDPLRKFCNGCGTSLRVSCLECSTEMPVWEKFCGDCGASQEASLRTRLAALAAKSEEAEQQLADMNFEGARALARDILGVTDSRMQQLKSWADKFLDRVDSSFDDAINQAQLRLGESLKHEAAFDYRSGIKALENVPAVLWKEILPNAQASVETVFCRLKSKLKRTEELSRTVRDRVQVRQLSGLLADVKELSFLAPQRADVLKLKDQLLQRETKLKQARQDVLTEAEQQFQQQNYSGCLQFLSKVPSDFSLDKEVQDLLGRATTCDNRAKELRASIQASASKLPTAGILLLIDEYLKLRNNDREVQDLRQRLAVQLRKNEVEDAAKARLRKEWLWLYSWIGSGIAVLVLMALSFSVFTLLSWINREKLLQQPPLKNSIGMDLKLLPTGTFTMGEDDEAHQVTLTEPFYLGVYEVTQEQYEKVMGNNPSVFKDPRNPVENVSWDEAVEFCKRLSELPEEIAAGRVYRLPTEAEWEYACRAGSTTEFSFGDDDGQLGDYDWLDGNSNGKTHPVGQKKPNAWGLYDMHGNVKEWCSGWYGDYLKNAVTDPVEPNTGVAGDNDFMRDIKELSERVRRKMADARVYRGGSWRTIVGAGYGSSSRWGARSATNDIGVRVALSSSGTLQPRTGAQRDSTNNVESLPPREAVPPSQEPKLSASENAVEEIVPPKLAVEPYDSTVSEAESAADLSPTNTSLTNSIEMKLVQLPAGTFRMGEGDEAHQVTLTKPFYLGVYEVTQEQYEQVMGENPSKFKGPRNPVEMVSWDDAVVFCKRLSDLPEERAAGRVYRLPTEAEWEYACRAGSRSKYSFGDDEVQLGDYAWFSGNSNRMTHSVGQKKPNSWGLYDMHGNVWEWCSDWTSEYPKGTATDPVGPGEGSFRVRRGGGWFFGAFCGSSDRSRYGPSHRGDVNGFRVALSSSGIAGIEPASQNDSAKINDAKTQDDVPEVQEPTPPTATSTSDKSVSQIVPLVDRPEVLSDKTTTQTLLTNSIGMTLVQLPAGTFTMGEGGEVHQVTLTKPFYLGVYEVTQEEYEKVIGNNPSEFKDPHNPVEQVSWHDAVEFCKKLSELPEEKAAGRVYRLPTEAEWEYACRAGSTTRYSFGGDAIQLGDYAWFSGNSNRKTHSVGQKKPNAWGLYDMHGNAWEWCADWHGDLPIGEVNDPIGPDMGSKRVNRGGSWDHVAENCRSALHNGHDPFHRGRTGFRIAASPHIETPPVDTNNEGNTKVLFGGDLSNLGFDPRTATLQPFDLETPDGPTDNLEWRFRLAGKSLRPLEQGNLKWRSLRYSRDHQPYVLDEVIDIGSLVLTLRTETGARTQINGKLHLIDSRGLKPFKKDLAVALTVEVETRKQAVKLEYDQLKSTRAKPGEGDKKNAELEKLASAMQACDRIQNLLAFAIEHNDEILESGLAFELVQLAAEGEVILLRSNGPSKVDTARSSFTNSIGMRLTQLPGGTFMMGEGDMARQVTLTKPFHIGVHEVKQEQYEKVMGTNPSQFKGPSNPVEQVSWHNAVEFCKKLSELPEEKAAGRIYRLPTEAEWEYACRAGSETDYSFGNEVDSLGEYAWYSDNSNLKTHPVGRKKSNAWGLYDMHGNVLEWCADRPDEFPENVITIGLGQGQGARNPGVRGGCWGNVATACRSASLNDYSRDHESAHMGFRVALSP